jgi:creatinine amidohydrolase
MLDALSSARALERARPSIAVLPIGSIEQHSHHLPLGTDWIAATALAHHVASALGAYLLPALPVSMGRCHKPMAGTVWVRPMTLADAVTDVVHSVLKSGIRNVVLINGHGGNFTLEVAVRELNAEPDGPVVLLPPMSLRAGSQPIFETAGREVHAGESETSVFLAIAPDLVGDQRVDHIPSVGREFLDYALIGQISPSGVWGKPSLALVEKGRRALDARVRSVVSWVRETLDAVARLRDLPAPRFAPDDGDGPTWLGWGPWDGSARGMLDYRATTFQVEAARPHTAILPVAAAEAHGPHLPVGCDLLVVEALTRRVADLLGPGVYRLPTIPFGNSTHARGLHGTADLTPDALRRVIQEIAVALHGTGIDRVAVIAGPGLAAGNTVVPFGNFIAKAAVRQLNHEHPDLDAIWVQPLAAASRALGEIFESARDDIHAGEVETSLMLALCPDAVGDGAVDHVPQAARDMLDLVPLSALAPAGVWGRPSLATRAKGEEALSVAAEATAAYIRDTLAALVEMKKAGRCR